MNRFAKYVQAPQNRFAKYIAKEPDYGIDFTAGHEGVRLGIDSLPEDQRSGAMQEWARTRMANPQGADAVLSAASSNAPGRSAMLGLDDEIFSGIDAGLNTLSGGALGAPYDEGLALRRAATERFAKDNPVMETVGQVAGGLAMPGVGGGRSALQRLAGAAGGGAAFSAANTFGTNEGGDGNLQQQFANRLEWVPESAAIGAGAGLAFGGAAELMRGIGNVAARHGSLERDALTKVLDSLPDKSVERFADQLSQGANRANAKDAPKFRQAFDILGEEMVNAKGDAVLGQNKAVDRIIKDMGVSRATAKGYIKSIQDSHGNGELFIGEYPSVASSDAATRTIKNLDDKTVDVLRSSEDTSAMTPYSYVARAGGTQGAQKLRTKFDERTMRQKGPLRDWMNDAAPEGIPDPEKMLDDIDAAAERAYGELDALGDNGFNQAVIFHDLPQILKKHTGIAALRGGEQAKALRDGIDKFYINIEGPNGPQKVAMPTLTILQDQRQALRHLMDNMRGDPIKKTSDAPGSSQLQGLYSDVTELMRRASPRWSKANDMYAGRRIREKLMDFGKNLTANPGDAQRTAFKYFDKVAPEAQDWMRVRVLQSMDDMITGKGDTHDLAKLYTNENWRNIITKVFPRHRTEMYLDKSGKTKERKVLDRTSENFIRLIRNMQVANRNKNRASGNSVTGEVMEMNKAMDADLNMVASAQTMNVQGWREAITQAMVNTLKGFRVRRMEQILSTQARDVPNAAMRVEQLRRQKARIQDTKNRPRSDWPSRGAYGVGSVDWDGE